MEQELHGLYKFFAEIPLSLVVLFVAPFVMLLLSIAILPLTFPHFWEKNRNKLLVSIIFGLPIAFFFLYKDWTILAKTATEYGAFIALLGTLFVISGGIYVRGSFKGHPLTNTAFLTAGALLSNFIGTTGASMLLIRPLIRANHDRHNKAHTVIFFIFIVSNCSGLLTPLGDPPLFLGFLKGVPFVWTFRLFPQFLIMMAWLLAAFLIIDSYLFKKEKKDVQCEVICETPIVSERFGIEGRRNLPLLALVMVVILFSGYVLYPRKGPMVFGEPYGVVLSEMFQILAFTILAIISYRVTPGKVHEKNHFNFEPIIEVAILFAGIFAAMIPALIILETRGANFGVNKPWQFFWLTGALSSFLDNAPTYLTFTSLAKGVLGLTGEGLRGLVSDPMGQKYLAAISCGAVCMGANTYIGNGPNFMVKSIAEHHKIKMPSFFGYMAWSACVLIPIFILATIVGFAR
jgi:Na+/H+ antiporter NhaD/arsenite permease-like protein